MPLAGEIPNALGDQQANGSKRDEFLVRLYDESGRIKVVPPCFPLASTLTRPASSRGTRALRNHRVNSVQAHGKEMAHVADGVRHLLISVVVALVLVVGV